MSRWIKLDQGAEGQLKALGAIKTSWIQNDPPGIKNQKEMPFKDNLKAIQDDNEINS